MASRGKNVGAGPLPFLDDAERAKCRNGQPAIAAIVAKEASLLNAIAYGGRPLYNMIGGDATIVNAANGLRQVFPNEHAAHREERAVWDITTSANAYAAGQGVRTRMDATLYDQAAGGDSLPARTYPADVVPVVVPSDYGFASSGAHSFKEVAFDSVTANGPVLHSGLFYSAGAASVDPSLGAGVSAYTAPDGFVSGGDIIGWRTGGKASINRLEDMFRRTWFYRRPQVGWSAMNPGTNYVALSTSTADYRYLFDQSYGVGGSSFSATSPAMTLPLRYSAAGLRTQIRVYVFVYAAVSTTVAGQVGDFAVANKNSSGTMASAPTALTNPITVNSTSFAWYPALETWSAATGAYFNAYAGTSFDRVALCGRSTGGGEFPATLRVGAFTFYVQHSVA